MNASDIVAALASGNVEAIRAEFGLDTVEGIPTPAGTIMVGRAGTTNMIAFPDGEMALHGHDDVETATTCYLHGVDNVWSQLAEAIAANAAQPEYRGAHRDDHHGLA